MINEQEIEDLGNALLAVVWRFAIRSVKGRQLLLCTDGEVALEDAFRALGWQDPHEVQAQGNACEVEQCFDWAVMGQEWKGLYLNLCQRHLDDAVEGYRRPRIKEWALAREAAHHGPYP